MEYTPPSKCSVCGSEFKITKLTCPQCSAELSGSFTPCKYCSLNDKLKLFLETFLKSRGNIKEVEKSLAISYPTVKSLLDELIAALFSEEKPQSQDKITSAQILDMLENGTITASEAAELLKNNN